MFSLVFILTTVGFLIATYSFHVDQKLATDITYKPICDVSDYISCSKGAQSPYGKWLGFSNSVIGMVYYVILGILVWLGHTQVALYLSGIAIIASAILAYILFFKIRVACPLCISSYVINMLIFFSLYNM